MKLRRKLDGAILECRVLRQDASRLRSFPGWTLAEVELPDGEKTTVQLGPNGAVLHRDYDRPTERETP